MQTSKLQIKKRIVYKHKSPITTNSQNKPHGTFDESNPTIWPTGTQIG